MLIIRAAQYGSFGFAPRGALRGCFRASSHAPVKSTQSRRLSRYPSCRMPARGATGSWHERSPATPGRARVSRRSPPRRPRAARAGTACSCCAAPAAHSCSGGHSFGIMINCLVHVAMQEAVVPLLDFFSSRWTCARCWGALFFIFGYGGHSTCGQDKHYY